MADRPPDVKEVHVVWMTTGLGCDGDSVSVTAATLPSIEEIVLGARNDVDNRIADAEYVVTN